MKDKMISDIVINIGTMTKIIERVQFGDVIEFTWISSVTLDTKWLEA